MPRGHLFVARPRPKSSSKTLPIIVALVVVLLGGWAFKTFFGTTGPVNILLMGLDEGKVRTDVVVLAHVDPQKKIVNLLSIPRDTLVEIDCTNLHEICRTPDKLAHAHAYGGEKGPEVTVKTVERLLDIKIDHYVRVDFDGFEQVVDTLGGVDLVIEKNMDYEDPYAHPPLSIHFKGSPEPQHLDGNLALKYVRFRADGLGDIGRTERTKRFLVALAKKAKEGQSLTKLPSVVSTVLAYTKTDVDGSTAAAIARSALGVNFDQVQMATLPGADDSGNAAGWVWVPDQAKMAEVVDRLIRNPQPVAAEPAPAK